MGWECRTGARGARRGFYGGDLREAFSAGAGTLGYFRLGKNFRKGIAITVLSEA